MKFKNIRQHKPQPSWTAKMCREFCPYVLVQLGAERLFARTSAGVEGADVHPIGTSIVLTVAWATVASALCNNTAIMV